MNEPKRPASDAEWYCRKDPEADQFYEIFFKMCRKYHFAAVFDLLFLLLIADVPKVSCQLVQRQRERTAVH